MALVVKVPVADVVTTVAQAPDEIALVPKADVPLATMLVGPVGPVAPVGPMLPVGPVGPVAPVGPVGPVLPVLPVDPVGPVKPVGPVAPVGPVLPVGPVAPVGPVGPVTPVLPVEPAAPMTCTGEGLGACAQISSESSNSRDRYFISLLTSVDGDIGHSGSAYCGNGVVNCCTV